LLTDVFQAPAFSLLHDPSPNQLHTGARGERYPPFELCLTWDSQARAALQQGRKLFILDSCFARKDLKWPAAYERRGAIRVREAEDIWKALG
jgi:hypothetical protein